MAMNFLLKSLMKQWAKEITKPLKRCVLVPFATNNILLHLQLQLLDMMFLLRIQLHSLTATTIL